MTCVVGLAVNSNVWIGADSQAGDGGDWPRTQRSDSKVFILDQYSMDLRMLIGFTWSWRFGQLLRYGFELPPHPDGMATHEYLCTLFVDAVRARLREGGYAKIESNREDGGHCLIGYCGQIWTLYADYQIEGHGVSLDAITGDDVQYYAVGSGMKYACGALYATPGICPRDRVLDAIRAAAHFDRSVGGPFTIECLEFDA